MTAADGFDGLGDAEKVKFCETEIAATVDRLNNMIAQLAALRTEVDDPDGLVRFTLGDDVVHRRLRGQIADPDGPGE
jgi:hypothetical protein